MENYGQLAISDQSTGKAISKAYVKVYAKLNNGKDVFYKDGYTDFRGFFFFFCSFFSISFS